MRPLRILAAAAALLAAACDLAPDYTQPQAPVSGVFKEYGAWKTAFPADTATRGEWWKIFGDAGLDQLELKIPASNQDLQAAVARYREAAALAGESYASLFPAVSANGSIDRNRQSDNGPLFKAGSSPKHYNDDTMDLSLSWELDVWGRVRNAVAASDAAQEASAADLEGLDLMLHAELASDYFSLRGDDQLARLLDTTVIAYQKALDLTINRYKGKIASEIDVDQAQTQLQNARAQADDTRLRRALMEHAIAVLVGQSPTEFSLPPQILPKEAPVVAPGLPSTLLERRPDVAAAERRVFAANAEIGVARAAYFPTFSLNALVGLESNSIRDWISAPSHFWSLGPSAALPVVDFGLVGALNAEARAAYDETVANYRQTVLTAYQDVEDSLASQRQYDAEWGHQELAAAAAERALNQSEQQYKMGLVTYLQVVTSQTTSLQTEQAAVNAQVERLNATVSLIRALGGGWTPQAMKQPPELALAPEPPLGANSGFDLLP